MAEQEGVEVGVGEGRVFEGAGTVFHGQGAVPRVGVAEVGVDGGEVVGERGSRGWRGQIAWLGSGVMKARRTGTGSRRRRNSV